MDRAKVFNTGRSQAVRLPKEYRFDVDEVYVARLGQMVILYPPGKGWDLMASSLGHFTDDFMVERDQPARAEQRAEL